MHRAHFKSSSAMRSIESIIWPVLAFIMLWALAAPEANAGCSKPIQCGERLEPVCTFEAGDCQGLFQDNGDTNPFKSVEAVLSCLLGWTTFATDPRTRVNDTTPFETILPNQYNTLGNNGAEYSEFAVDEVIRWARRRIAEPHEDRCQAELLLMEASYRKASAHGMFADDRILRGLNPDFLIGLETYTNDPLVPGLLLLDSRICVKEDNLGDSSRGLCLTDADCSAPEVCRPCRFDEKLACRIGAGGFEPGVFGAIQEYRRAESAIADAASALTNNRFRELDRLTGCRGGCSAALLLHMGANKLRAQALRLDTLWGRAATHGWPPKQAYCTNESAQGANGQFDACSLDSDCDRNTSNPDPKADVGQCSAPGSTQRHFVQFRQAADEAFTEAGAAYSVYNSIIAPDVLAKSTDLNVMRGELGALNEVVNRAVSGLTPFGLPPDYVPMLTDEQRTALGCFTVGSDTDCENQKATGDAGSVAQCLENFLTANSKRNVFDYIKDAVEAQNNAGDLMQAMATEMANHKKRGTELRSSILNVVGEMLGAECPDGKCCKTGGEGCCSADDFTAARCVQVTVEDQVHVWEVTGLRCEEPGALLCDSASADGRIETALQDVQAARAAVGKIDLDLAQLDEKFNEIGERFAKLQNVKANTCTDLAASIVRGGNIIAAKRRETKIEGWRIAVIAGNTLAAGTLSGASSSPWGALTGAGAGAAQANNSAIAHELENRRIEIEAEITTLQSQQEAERLAISCEGDAQVLAITEEEALFDLAQQRTSKEFERFQREFDVIRTLSGVAQIGAEFQRRLADALNAAEIKRIWEDSFEFQNPLNYRILATNKQLEARERFRAAQMAVWMLLRATAYDRAEPDYAFTGSGPLRPQTFGVPQCEATRCKSGRACTTDAECSANADDACVVASWYASGTDGNDEPPSCSLQTVFAARAAADLRDVVYARALDDLSSELGPLACGSDKVCQKQLSLKRIFTDPFADGQEGRRSLGDVLAERAGGTGEAFLDFSIVLDRDFKVCPELGGGGGPTCLSLGVAPLLEDSSVLGAITYGSGPLVNVRSTTLGSNAPNLWGQKLFGVKGTVSFSVAPEEAVCRLRSTGAVVGNGEFPIKDEFTCNEYCPSGQECRVEPLAAGAAVNIQLFQLEAGRLRTQNASFQSAGTLASDDFVSFRVRQGDLFTEGRRLRPFASNVIQVGAFETSSPWECGVRGVPVASPRWRIRVDSGASGAHEYPAKHETFFKAIDDIYLYLNFQARQLPTAPSPG